MPQSLSAIYIHIIFSTKNRVAYLRDISLRNSLHAYLGSISNQLDCQPIIVGGIEDHVHILTTLSRTMSVAEIVKELKRVSTNWIKEQSRNDSNLVDLADFQWQTGYAGFSVSQSNLPEVKTYIANQEQHHAKKTFRDELLAFLQKHQIQPDERYLWD